MRTTRCLALGIVLLFGAGCAQRADWIGGTLVTVDVTGVWTGRAYTPVGGGGGEMEMSLEQRGPKVTGEYRYRSHGKDFITGTVRGDVFSFRDADGDMRGELKVDGDDLSGQGLSRLFQQGEFKLRLRRQQPGGPPESR
jgi:hypothetical protein